MQKLASAISDTGRAVLPEHLYLVADCLSSTGEFVALSANGLARQRKHTSVSSPFMQACFSVSSFQLMHDSLVILLYYYNILYSYTSIGIYLFGLLNVLQSPADCFVNAAKMGTVDNLQGSIDSLAWGNSPSLGTGAQFDILYSGKVCHGSLFVEASNKLKNKCIYHSTGFYSLGLYI